MNYSLTINNQSGSAQNVAVFQVNSPSSGSSLVWLSQTISDGSSHCFTWDITWSLGYGSTSQPLNTGVLYQSESLQSVQPNEVNGNNELQITYTSGSFTSNSPSHDRNLQPGVIQIITDETFTVKESLNMSVALYMYDKPILASQGAPNSRYYFNTDTIYYLTVTDYLIGSVLPALNQELMLRNDVVSFGAVMSQPTKVEFADGQTQAKYNLTDTLAFVQKG